MYVCTFFNFLSCYVRIIWSKHLLGRLCVLSSVCGAVGPIPGHSTALCKPTRTWWKHLIGRLCAFGINGDAVESKFYHMQREDNYGWVE